MMDEIVKRFQKGEILIFPTDTIYGIGCVLNNVKSIKRLYKIRKTPLSKPSIVLACDLDQACEYGNLGSEAKKVCKKFWPGPLTIIVKAKKEVPKIIQGKMGTVAIRVPDQPQILNIIKQIDSPILAPSANMHNNPSPISFSEIDKKLIYLVDYAIDSAMLPNTKKMLGIPSAIIDFTVKPFEIVRTGSISNEDVRKVLGGT